MLAIIVSAGALALGLVNFARAGRLDRRDLFLRMHDSLIEPEIVAGRRALYRLDSESAAENLDSDDVTRVYRALALFDVLGLYAEKRWVSERTVQDEWGDSLRRSWQHAEHFIAVRRRMTGQDASLWPHYQGLAERAASRKPDGLRPGATKARRAVPMRSDRPAP